MPRRLNRLDDIDLSALTNAARHAETIRLESTPTDPLDLHVALGCTDATTALDVQKQLIRAIEKIGQTPDLPAPAARLLKSLRWNTEEARLIAQFTVPVELLREPLLALKQERPEYWLAALHDEDARCRAEAHRRLLALKSRALPVLSPALLDRNAKRRQAAAEMLGDLGADAADATALLAQAIGDSEAAVRHAAIVSLEKIGPTACRAAFTSLLTALGDADESVSQAARSALAKAELSLSKDSEPLVTALGKTRLGVKPRLYVLDVLADMKLETKVLVPILVETLRDPQMEVRRRAAFHLGKHGSKERQSVLPALLSALKDQELDVRTTAIASLDALATFRPAETSLLIDAYKDDNMPADSRAVVVRWLGEMGADVKDTVFPILLDARNRPDAEVRKAAATALEHMGTAGTVNVAQVLASLNKRSTSVENRLYAVRLLGEAGPRAREAYSTLLELLDDKSPELRGAALAALERIGPPSQKEMDSVVVALHNPSASTETRRYAAGVLGDSSMEPPQAARLLLKTLTDRETSVRRAAASSLVKLKPQSREALEAYEAALADADTEVRLQITTALVELPPANCPTATLLKAFADDEDSIARKAVEGLAHKGKPVKEDVPILTAALRHKKARVRICAADALVELGADAAKALAALTEAVKDTDTSVRILALTALRGLGEEAESAAPVVARVLNEDNAAVRLHAAVTLLRLHQHAKDAVPIVFEAARDKNNADQDLAVEALGWVGPWAADAASYLLAALQKEETRSSAGPLLVKLGKAAVPDLNERLKSSDEKVRLAAVETLGQIGRDAVVALLRVNTLALKDPSEEVRLAARKASLQIQGRE
jgi:HEAT repeat protein